MGRKFPTSMRGRYVCSVRTIYVRRPFQDGNLLFQSVNRQDLIGHHHGHQGIVIATWCLYDHMQKRLAEIMTTYGRKGYELVFTGHSLGGGCATLLSILLHPRYGAKCYGFGTPPCVTKELAEGKARMNDL